MATIAGILAALIGLIGALSGAALLADPVRAAGTLDVDLSDRVAGMYARFSGIRNLASGGLLLWAAYALAIAHPPGAASFAVALGLAWAAVQGCDAAIFARLGSRGGALAAGALALASLALAALSLLG